MCIRDRSPTYDLRVEDLKNPVKLFYKANVYQNSGVKWDKIKITLSTGNPSEGAQAPALQPWYLAFYNPVAYGEGYMNSYQNQAAPRAKAIMMDSITEDAKAPAAGALNNYVPVSYTHLDVYKRQQPDNI